MGSPFECRVRVAGELGHDWTAWFDGLAVESLGDGTTEIAGCLPDHAALYGLLAALRDLGMEVLLIEARGRGADPGPPTERTAEEPPSA